MSNPNTAYDPIATDFLILIGRIVIGWSQIERAIDIVVMSGRSLIPEFFKKGPPRSLKEKAKALRAICNKLLAFEKHLGWINQRMNEFLDLAGDRHTIIHGYFHGIAVTSEPTIYFRRAPPLSGLPGERLIATRSELEEFLKKLKRIDSDLMPIVLMVPQEIRKERRKASSN